MELQRAFTVALALYSLVGCKSVQSPDIASGSTDGNSDDGAVIQSEGNRSLKKFDRANFLVPFDFSSVGAESGVNSVSSGMNTPSAISSIEPASNTLGLNSVINGFVLVGEIKSRDIIDNRGIEHNVVEELRYEYDYRANTIETKYSVFRFEMGPKGPDLINYNENGWKTKQQSGKQNSLRIITQIMVDENGNATNETRSLELTNKPSITRSIARVFNNDGTLQSSYRAHRNEEGSLNYFGSTEYIYEAGRLSSTHKKLSNGVNTTKVYYYDDVGRVSAIAIDQDADDIADSGFLIYYDNSGNISTVLEVDSVGELVSTITYSYEQSPEAVYNITFRRLKYSIQF